MLLIRSLSRISHLVRLRENTVLTEKHFQLRLKGDGMSEVEAMITRFPGSTVRYEAIVSRLPDFRHIIPADQRNIREKL